MSSITMAADSTQSEIKDSLKGKKHKKNMSKKKKKTKVVRNRRVENESNSDCDSDMDLNKELKPIGGYLQDRELTVEHMFRSISGKKLKAMLPEILKPIPVNQLKKLCIEQLDCMSKKRISRILEGADPETISSTGTEEDSSLSDDDKRQDGSTDPELHSDTVGSNQKEGESHIPGATCQPDNLQSPQSCVSKSRSRSSSSSRSESPGYGSYRSVASSEQSSKNSSDSESRRYTEQSEPESSPEEIVEEVVYEEVVLEDGDDLESILSHGSFLKGTKDVRLKTVAAHKDDLDDKDDDVMLIEREEREEEQEVISVDDEDPVITPATGDSTTGDGNVVAIGVEQRMERTSLEQSDIKISVDSLECITSTLSDTTTVTSVGSSSRDSISSQMETAMECHDVNSKLSEQCDVGCGDNMTNTGEQQSQPLQSGDNVQHMENDSKPELEEGEIEDSSSECEELDEENIQVEMDIEKGNTDDQLLTQHANKDGASGKKKKVRVIKRIIKVIRKKPKLEGQSASVVSRELPKKPRVSHQAKYRQDTNIPSDYMNVRIKTEPGLEQSTSCGTSPRSSSASKSIAKSSVHAKVKREPSTAATEHSDLASVSEKSLNQMEILELEMRARAIKAMLKKQEEKDKHIDPKAKKRIKLKRKMTEN